MIAMQAADRRMGASRGKPYIVLVGMDFSDLSNLALREALLLSAQREGAELHVACIVPEPALKGRHPLLQEQWIVAESAVIEGVFVSLRCHVQAEIEAFPRRSEHGEPRAPRRVVPHVRVDAPGLGMAGLAADLDADLIVLGARGQGKAVGPLGSAAETTLRLAPCPVLIVRSEAPRASKS
jgi:nucleotide-binding universal stress UspA family protein